MKYKNKGKIDTNLLLKNQSKIKFLEIKPHQENLLDELQ